MRTEVVRESESEAEMVARAVSAMDGGGLVVFPTETVYGVGVRTDRTEALARLKTLKGRPDRPFTVHLGDKKDYELFVPHAGRLAKQLMRKLWPGPLTLIVDAGEPGWRACADRFGRDAANEIYHDHTVGLRCPDHEMARQLLKKIPVPVVAASANRAGEAAANEVSQVLANLEGVVDLVLDGGETRYRRASTIVQVSGCTYEIKREGVYDAGIIERASRARILFVCTGNTCRSPMAEGLTKQIAAEALQCSVEELPARGVIVQSAGTAGGFGGASPAAIEVLKKRNIDIGAHYSTQLTVEAIESADHVLVMTQSHKAAVLAMVPTAENRVQLLLGDEEVHDPVGGGVAEYEASVRLMERGIRDRLKEILS